MVRKREKDNKLLVSVVKWDDTDDEAKYVSSYHTFCDKTSFHIYIYNCYLLGIYL